MGASDVGVGAAGGVFFSEREEKIAAVVAAPVAAEIPAIMAKVVFDMATDEEKERWTDEADLKPL